MVIRLHRKGEMRDGSSGIIFSAYGPANVIGPTHGLPRLEQFLEAMEAYRAMFERGAIYQIKLFATSALTLLPSFSPPISNRFFSTLSHSTLGQPELKDAFYFGTMVQ